MGRDGTDDPGGSTGRGGRPRRVPKREIVEAILHLLRAGRSWRLLPHDFPPSQTDYHHLRGRGARRGLDEGSSRAGHGGPGARRTRSFALGCDHQQPDRQDGGSIGGLEGYDAGKKVHGRKRHIMTDTDGRLLTVRSMPLTFRTATAQSAC
jgi:transposase